jgi:hypothetical protein
MKSNLLRAALQCGLLLFAGLSCAPRLEVPLNPPPPDEPAPVVAPAVAPVSGHQPAASPNLGTEARLSEITLQVADQVFTTLAEKAGGHLGDTIAVVAAVPLSDFKRESEFGRLYAEYLLTDLAARGLRIAELRLGREIHILPQTGEFLLTRNIGELAPGNPFLDYVLVSTFSNTPRELIIQGRLVSLRDGRVEIAWRHTMPLNRELLALFNELDQPYTMAVRGVQR